MRRTTFFGMLLFVTIVLVQPGWSQIPQTVSYQGILTDADGVVVDGTVNLTFKLYETETGDISVWTETQNGVPVSDGIFNVILGSVGDLGIVDDSGDPIPFDRQYWLGVTIGAQDEHTPRVQLTASPYSLSAKSVSGDSNVFPSDGNVGIGTTSPSYKLDVNGTSSITGSLFWGNNVDPGGARGMLGYGTGVSIGSETNHPLRLYVNGSEKARIATSGNVGIGTTDPGGLLGLKDPYTYLNVDGTNNLTFTDVVTGTKTLADLAAGGAGGGHSLDAADGSPTDAVYVDNDGNVGIGTTNPDAKLDVEVSSGGAATIGSSDNSATGDRAVAMGHNTEASGYYSTAMGLGTGAIGFSSTAMGQITTASGNVSTAMGLSTTASGKYSTAMGRAIEAAGDYSVGIGLDDTTRTITQDNTMAIMGGKVGIGTVNPTEKLEVSGTVKASEFVGNEFSLIDPNTYLNVDVSNNLTFTDVVTGTKTLADLAAGGDNLWTSTNGNIYRETGNVGIGTTDPTEKLEVAGTVKATSFEGDGSGLTGVGAGDEHSLDAADGSPTDAVYVDNDGNVGIGTTSPGEKLEIAGNLKVTGDLIYSSAKTSYYAIPSCAFMPSRNSYDWYHSNGSLGGTTAGQGVSYLAPINIPHGATLTQFIAVIKDNAATEDISLHLLMQDRLGGAAIIGDLLTSSGTPGQCRLNSTPLSEFRLSKIDNLNYAYLVQAWWTTPPTTTDIELFHVQIVYEVTSVLP